MRAAALAAAFSVLLGCGGRSDTSPPFDGARALDLIKKQCSLGPRYSRTPGHKAAGDLIFSELDKLADAVHSHTFTRQVGEKQLEFQNIYAVFNPRASRFILLSAHWDTRPIADQEIDPEKRRKPIPGANDGASGVAVLLELARAFHAKTPPVGVVMAFFDGEDYGTTPDEMFIGSEEFAKDWRNILESVIQGGTPESAIRNPQSQMVYGILLDMVGDSELEIRREEFSVRAAPKVVEKVWSAARRTGHSDVFLDTGTYSVQDDHIPITVAGLPCIDIIDFNYAHWHTLDDTPDKCSAKSLQAVGEVVGRVVYEEKGR